MKRFLFVLVAVLLLYGLALAAPPLPQTSVDQSKMAITGQTVGKVVIATGYATLQAAADAAGAGGHLYIPKGTYTNGIALTSAHNGITIEGAGYGTYIHVSSGSAITLTGTEGTPIERITIRNLRIQTDSTSDTDYGISGEYTYHCQFLGNTFELIKGHSLRLRYPKYTTIDGNYFGGDKTNPGYSHIWVYSGKEIIITRNHIWQTDAGYGVNGTGIYVEGDQNITISNNDIRHPCTGIWMGWVYNGMLTGNVIWGCNEAVVTDGGPVGVVGNALYFSRTGLRMLDGAGPVSGNIFWKCPKNIAFGGWMASGSVFNNLMQGGESSYEVAEDKTWWAHAASNFLAGELYTVYGGLEEGWITGENTFKDGRDWISTHFANVRPGDILHLTESRSMRDAFYRIKSVTLNGANSYITIEGRFTTSSKTMLGYSIYREMTAIGDRGSLILAKNALVTGGGRKVEEHVLAGAVTEGSVAGVAVTAGGTGYATNDLVWIWDGSKDALVKVTGQTGGVVDTIALVESGSHSYTVGAGHPTMKFTGSGAGLTVEITAVGLTEAQVSDTVLTNTGQGDANVSNYLPTARKGMKFTALMPTAKTNFSWSLANSPGIQNGASGDLINLDGTDGTAGSAHGVQVGSAATNISKGDRLDCYTASTADGAYQWFCKAVQGTTWAAY